MERWKATLWSLAAVVLGVLVGLTERPGGTGPGPDPERPEVRAPASTPGRQPSAAPPPRAVSEVSEAQLLERLEAARRGGDSRALEEATRRLGEVGTDRAVRALVDLFDGPASDDGVRRAALRALERIGGAAAVDALAGMARQTSDAELRAQAEVRLSRIDDRSAAPALVRLVEEEKRRGPLATAAVRALGKTRLRSQVALLLELGREGQDEALRIAAVDALGRVGDPEAVEGVGALLQGPAGRLRRSAIRALGRIRADEALRFLEGFLEGEPPDFERNLAEEAIAAQKGLADRSPFR